MKVALLLPGYLDSPDYLHLTTFDAGLRKIGYTVERLDACNIWQTGDVSNYSLTNYIKQIQKRVEFYQSLNSEEIILIGHSMGGFAAIITGETMPSV